MLSKKNLLKPATVRGIKIIYEKGSVSTQNTFGRTARTGRISIHISPRNFENAFTLYQEFTKLLTEKETFYVHLRLNDSFDFVKLEEDIAALLSDVSDWCCPAKEHVGLFVCEGLNVKFRIVDLNAMLYKDKPDFLLNIMYDPNIIEAKSIVQLIECLYEMKLIYKKTEE